MRTIDAATTFLTSGLLTSFKAFMLEVHDFSLILSGPPASRSVPGRAGRLRMGGCRDPQVYDLELMPEWHQVAIFNSGKRRGTIARAVERRPGDDTVRSDSIRPVSSTSMTSGPTSWSVNCPGTAKLEQNWSRCTSPCFPASQGPAQPAGALHPARHVLQGAVDLADVRWDAAARTLSGKARSSAANRSESRWLAMA